MGRDDLIPLSKRSREEVQEIARKGGINSGIARRQRRTVKEVASAVLGMRAPLTQKEKVELSKRWGVKPEDLDVLFVSMAKVAMAAIKGDLRAFEVIRDSAGEKPQDSVNMQHNLSGDAVIRIGFEEPKDAD